MTGVQTCALPIWTTARQRGRPGDGARTAQVTRFARNPRSFSVVRRISKPDSWLPASRLVREGFTDDGSDRKWQDRRCAVKRKKKSGERVRVRREKKRKKKKKKKRKSSRKIWFGFSPGLKTRFYSFRFLNFQPRFCVILTVFPTFSNYDVKNELLGHYIKICLINPELFP